MTEQALIQATLEGDTEAFSQLVHAHQGRIRMLCLSYLGSAAEADDAAQDVFIKAFKGLPRFKGESAFATWLGHIAINHCKDLLRTRTRQATQSLDALLAEKGDSAASLLREPQEPGARFGPEERELLGALLGTLSEEEREILALREVEGLSYEAIAAQLACTLDAVKGRLKRARRQLEEHYRLLDVTPSSKPGV
jgi:RNA polymerase sigma-70 factor, ECF subfamily